MPNDIAIILLKIKILKLKLIHMIKSSSAV